MSQYLKKIQFHQLGVFDIQSKVDMDQLDGTDYFLLGQEPDSMQGTFYVNQAFSGKLGDVVVWNTSLAQSEIMDYHDSC